MRGKRGLQLATGLIRAAIDHTENGDCFSLVARQQCLSYPVSEGAELRGAVKGDAPVGHLLKPVTKVPPRVDNRVRR